MTAGCSHAPSRSLDQRAHRAESPEQGGGVHDTGAAGVGVAQPLESRCAAAEQRHRMTPAGVAEQQVGKPARR